MFVRTGIGVCVRSNMARRVVCGVAIVLAVTGALLLGACTSEADLVKTLSTETDSAKRLEAATDLAGRASLLATEQLVDAAASDGTAADGLDALAEQYGVLLADTIQKAIDSDQEKLGTETVAKMRTMVDCIGCMDTTRALEVLGDFVLVDGHKLSDAPGVQIRALMAISEAPSEEAVTELIAVGQGLSTSAQFDDLREGLEKCLGKCGELAVAPLLPLVDDNEWAAWGLVYAGSPAVLPLLNSDSESKWVVLELMGDEAVPALTDAMRGKDRDKALNAACTLAYIGEYNSRSIREFTDALDQKDLQAVARDYLFFIAYGQPGSEAVIVDALLKYGTKQMGLDCLNSGNETLAAAGRKWGSRHGYVVKTGSSPQSVIPWGLQDPSS